MKPQEFIKAFEELKGFNEEVEIVIENKNDYSMLAAYLYNKGVFIGVYYSEKLSIEKVDDEEIKISNMPAFITIPKEGKLVISLTSV